MIKESTAEIITSCIAILFGLFVVGLILGLITIKKECDNGEEISIEEYRENGCIGGRK